jgi:hypothetical protein
VADHEKLHALKIISDQIVPGRWEECRPPSDKELHITKVVSFSFETGSAKIRTGPPLDDEEDYNLPFWAGLLPLEKHFGTPQPDPKLKPNIPIPDSLWQLTSTESCKMKGTGPAKSE